ncbi:MAG: glycosyltransferase [Chthoniobacter sp.]|nr:glycosyltransferase [Chthoniobacter sp.]
MSWPSVITGALAVGSALYTWLAASHVRAWLAKAAPLESSPRDLPPLTLLRPLKAGVPALRAKLDALIAAMHPGDQLILGADDGSVEMGVCSALRDSFPEREIVVVACRSGAALNPKISKLVQMTPHARHGHWLLSDSESLLDVAWLDAFRREWQTSGADVLTAGYRFVNLATWPQRLDASAALCGLWPGLAMVRRFGRVDFTLGAYTALRRADVEAVGGWAAFCDFLAEDNRLGAALAGTGRTIRLSAQVATLDADPLTWRDYWRHQRRVAVTYRACRPAGFAGMVFTNGLVASALLVALARVPSASVVAFHCVGFVMVIQLIRWWCFRALAKTLHFSIPWLLPVMLAASVVELACWIAAWFDRRVWWAGRRWRVSSTGRMQRAP